jgi:hypothetical protein
MPHWHRRLLRTSAGLPRSTGRACQLCLQSQSNVTFFPNLSGAILFFYFALGPIYAFTIGLED